MANEWYELLMTDHETTEKVFDAMTNAFQNPQGPPAEMVVTMLEYFTAYVDNCHNKKEENHLFPLIERRGIPRTGGPLAVMLAEHEQSRELLERLVPVARAYVAGDRGALGALRKMFEEYAALLK
ncbi:MAG: hemerythrin domain-containing protein, partial [Acidobacteria bacterium]|nr:hemerythrin domain-containing protein [Acidobacteriota bacterium]